MGKSAKEEPAVALLFGWSAGRARDAHPKYTPDLASAIHGVAVASTGRLAVGMPSFEGGLSQLGCRRRSLGERCWVGHVKALWRVCVCMRVEGRYERVVTGARECAKPRWCAGEEYVGEMPRVKYMQHWAPPPRRYSLCFATRPTMARDLGQRLATRHRQRGSGLSTVADLSRIHARCCLLLSESCT